MSPSSVISRFGKSKYNKIIVQLLQSINGLLDDPELFSVVCCYLSLLTYHSKNLSFDQTV